MNGKLIKAVSLFTVIVVLLFTMACQAEKAEVAQPAAEKEAAAVGMDLRPLLELDVRPEITITFGHVDPAGDWSTAKSHAFYLAFASIVQSKTAGRVQVVEYPAMQMGGEREMFEAVQTGTLNMTAIGEATIAGFFPPVQVLSIPYLFRSASVGHALFETQFGDDLAQAILDKAGVRILGWGELGMRHFLASSPINHPDDIRGKKLRVMESPIHMTFVRALGGNPTPISFAELYTALEQKVVDGNENPPYVVKTFRLYEVQDYYYLDGHWWAVQPIAINEDFFQSLPNDVKDIVLEAAAVATQVNRGVVTFGNQLDIDWLRAQGMNIHSPTADDLKILRERSQKPVIDVLKGQLGRDADIWIGKLADGLAEAETRVYGRPMTKIPGN